MGATGVEKTSSGPSTSSSTATGSTDASGMVGLSASAAEAPKACSILDPDCEACQ
jgi:ribonucleoside-diphosphate reductase alpha chain